MESLRPSDWKWLRPRSRGGARGVPLPPKNFLRDVMPLHWSPTQTIDSPPCCKTVPSSGPPNENVWLRPWSSNYNFSKPTLFWTWNVNRYKRNNIAVSESMFLLIKVMTFTPNRFLLKNFPHFFSLALELFKRLCSISSNKQHLQKNSETNFRAIWKFNQHFLQLIKLYSSHHNYTVDLKELSVLTILWEP